MIEQSDNGSQCCVNSRSTKQFYGKLNIPYKIFIGMHLKTLNNVDNSKTKGYLLVLAHNKTFLSYNNEYRSEPYYKITLKTSNLRYFDVNFNVFFEGRMPFTDPKDETVYSLWPFHQSNFHTPPYLPYEMKYQMSQLPSWFPYYPFFKQDLPRISQDQSSNDSSD